MAHTCSASGLLNNPVPFPMRYPKLSLALITALLLATGCTTPPATSAAPATAAVVSDGRFNVRTFGATGDGKTLDTALDTALDRALDE